MPLALTNEMIFWALTVIGLISLINVIWLIFLARKINRLLGGTQAKNIQEAMVLHRSEIDKLRNFRDTINKYLESVEIRLRRSIQGVETVRFNPFRGTGEGGNQSFSTALIDETGNGVVVSGLYSRDRVSIFSKPIRNKSSEYELTEEEQEAIEKAGKKISNRG